MQYAAGQSGRTVVVALVRVARIQTPVTCSSWPSRVARHRASSRSQILTVLSQLHDTISEGA